MTVMPKGRLGLQNCSPNAPLKFQAQNVEAMDEEHYWKGCLFTWAEMSQHIKSPGKRVKNGDHHSIPTNLTKAKTF